MRNKAIINNDHCLWPSARHCCGCSCHFFVAVMPSLTIV